LTPTPLVSVVIPTHNSARYLKDAILSVICQTFDGVKCIVVDDGSTDETQELVTAFEGVSYVYQQNAGVSAARNHGASLVSEGLIAFLDADDVWLPTKLSHQVCRATRERHFPGLVYSGLIETDDALRPLFERPAPREGDALRNTLLLEPPGVSLAQTGLVPVEVFEAVGGFDENLSTSADTDLVIRIGMQFSLARVEECLALYRRHTGQMSESADAMERDMKLVLSRAFNSHQLPPQLMGLRRRALANLWLAVGGARISAGRVPRGVFDLLRAFISHPPRTASVLVLGALKRIRRLTGSRAP
jgi:glycosyltransferase involved in cell wall biosynthesis